MNDRTGPVVVVITGGEPLPEAYAPLAHAADVVIAADSGLEHALALGVAVDIAVGDFDSASPAALERVRAAGGRIERHPTQKDRTDLDLALQAAVGLGAPRVTVLGGAGGRLDHLLGNLLVLGAPEYATLELDARVGPARAVVVRGRTACLAGRPGELVSLFAVGGPATGVTTTGLLYALDAATLEPGSTRGISNVHTEPHASVTVAGGVLLVVHPGEDA